MEERATAQLPPFLLGTSPTSIACPTLTFFLMCFCHKPHGHSDSTPVPPPRQRHVGAGPRDCVPAGVRRRGPQFNTAIRWPGASPTVTSL